MNESDPQPQSQGPQPPEQVSHDEFDEADLEAIAQSRQQIARGEDMDWREVSAQLRRKYLNE